MSSQENVQINRQGKLYLCVSRYWLGAEACLWREHFISLISPCPDTSGFFSAPPPPLSSLAITSHFHLQLHSLLCVWPVCVYACVCVVFMHILALSCGPGRTPDGKRFYHCVWLAIFSHISSTLADRASRSIILPPFRPYTNTQATNRVTVARWSEPSVRTDVAHVIEPERYGAVVLPTEHMLSTEHRWRGL